MQQPKEGKKNLNALLYRNGCRSDTSCVIMNLNEFKQMQSKKMSNILIIKKYRQFLLQKCKTRFQVFFFSDTKLVWQKKTRQRSNQKSVICYRNFMRSSWKQMNEDRKALRIEPAVKE